MLFNGMALSLSVNAAKSNQEMKVFSNYLTSKEVKKCLSLLVLKEDMVAEKR